MSSPVIKRTTTSDRDFKLLIQLLDHELRVELQADQAKYDQFNFVPGIQTAVIVYAEEQPIACGCFKEYAASTVEIKRMYVQKTYRGQGLSKKVLQELETWAQENGYVKAFLETSIHFSVARRLYETNGYHIIPNYPPYEGLEEIVCMAKELRK
jgi:GNAT superfamily N-acetyltransferase